MTILKFKDYVGSVEADVERGVLRGKILFITDLVTYEAESVRALQQEFEAAVDDYVETCAEIGKEPQKSFTGQFNVRVEPECHKDLAIFAAADGLSLNAVVGQACVAYVSERKGNTRRVEHVHTVRIEAQIGAGVIATASQPIQWETHAASVH